MRFARNRGRQGGDHVRETPPLVAGRAPEIAQVVPQALRSLADALVATEWILCLLLNRCGQNRATFPNRAAPFA